MGAAEIAALARHLGLSEHAFIQSYTRLRPARDGLALLDKGPAADGTSNHECIFLEGRDCAVQPVKPIQCAGFPNTWNFPGWREVCEAVPSLPQPQPFEPRVWSGCRDSNPGPLRPERLSLLG